jgi:hypothetical protein
MSIMARAESSMRVFVYVCIYVYAYPHTNIVLPVYNYIHRYTPHTHAHRFAQRTNMHICTLSLLTHAQEEALREQRRLATDTQDKLNAVLRERDDLFDKLQVSFCM